MLSEEEALNRILTAVSPLPVESLTLSAALHSSSAKVCYATVPLPGFDNSAMDGYAVCAADTQTPTPIAVVDHQPAGKSKELRLPPHSAIRIFTGAPMPSGADAVIMQEDVSLSADGSFITCTEPVVGGENVRLTGADLCVGQRILDRGEKLTPARLAVLASQGLSQVKVTASPSVAIVTTGDELVPAGQPLEPGQIYNSNQILLEGLVRESGCSQVSIHHLPDNLEKTTQLLRELAASHDFVIISGGVSVGDHDHVKPALKAAGIQAELWRVKIKPGKPLLYATAKREGRQPCHIFGLPGNPVSSFVTFLIFVRAAILKASGTPVKSLGLPSQTVTLAQAISNPGDRPHYVRGSVEDGVFSSAGLQQSHALFTLSKANALLRMEPDQTLEAGATVKALICHA